MNLEDYYPDELIAEYRAELRRLYGEERAEKSEIYYNRGWYYINLAQRAPDGSCGIWSRANPYRKKQVIKAIENLRKREPDLTLLR